MTNHVLQRRGRSPFHRFGLIPMSVPSEPIISTGLQPGAAHCHRSRAASAALAHKDKPLKRLSPPGVYATGLKPGANRQPVSLTLNALELPRRPCAPPSLSRRHRAW